MPIDYSRYPSNWKTEIVPIVLKRANNCCEKCGLQNHSFVFSIRLWIKQVNRYKLRSIWFRHEEDAKREADGPIKKVKVILTVAHVDHDETNQSISLDRLLALCQMCHLRYDAFEKYRRLKEKWTRNNPKLL
jgi:hypothetical protein